MKKFASFLLALCLLLTCAPIYANAETYDSTQEDLLRQAREVFPEYADRLHLSQTANFSADISSSDEVVFRETRMVSEKETFGLSVMRSGNVVVTKGFTGYTISSAGSNSSQVGPDIIGNATFTMTCTAVIGSATVSGIGFIIHQNNSGYFTSYGSLIESGPTRITRGTESTTYLQHGLVFNASGAKKLYMSFSCYFENGRVVGQIS